MEKRQSRVNMNLYYGADLFCGAGGSSTGLLLAIRELKLFLQLAAVNHWHIALETHIKNHPDITHYNHDLADIDPRLVVPSGKLKIMIASPECTHFSRARGGKPRLNQKRASVKYVLRWIAALDIENILIENVPEFQDWGPLHRKGPNAGKQIKSRKGEYFKRFVRKLRLIGYNVDYRVLNAANYGDATTRKRLFILARKGKAVHWPRPTHAKNNGKTLFENLKPWRTAREILDFSNKGRSIFNRPHPLAKNTIKRIETGLRKFSGLPFVLGQQSQARPRLVTEPLPTIAGAGAIALIQPFILPQNSSNAPRSVDDPVPTITTTSRGIALVEPFIMNIDHGHSKSSLSSPISQPVQTILGKESLALVEPFLVPTNHGKEERANSISEPLPTITGFDALGLAQPFLVVLNGTEESQLDRSTLPISEPVPTVTGSGHIGIVEPYMIRYNGTGNSISVETPLPAQTSKDRFGLVTPIIVKNQSGQLFMLDIMFRMLTPKELARAMSFPEDYHFEGNRSEIVKQIGNAVPVQTAKALCKALLAD